MISMNSTSRAPGNTRRWLTRQSDRFKAKSRVTAAPQPAQTEDPPTGSEEFSFAELEYSSGTIGNSCVSSRSAGPPKDSPDAKISEYIRKTSTTQEPCIPAIPAPTLWENALSGLSDGQRKILEDFGIQNTSSLEDDIGIVRDLRNATDSSNLSPGKADKRPTITRVRIHKILRKMEKYVFIGDIALQQNPNIISLVWAGVRFCLTIALNDLQTFDGVSSALDGIAGMMGSCRTYEELYQSSQLTSAKPVIAQVQQLYIYCLRFMADAINYFTTAGLKRFTEGITNPFQEKFGHLIGEIDAGMKTLVERASVASQEYEKAEFVKLGGKIDKFRADMSKLLVAVDKTKQREFLKWLSEIHFTAHHEKTRDLRFDNTGNWLFGKTQWVDWIEMDTSSIMWIHGKAGSGKTVLSSLVIDALTETYNSTPTIFFYCNYGEEERGKASFVVATLLKQLSMRSDNLDPHLLSIFEKGIALSMEPAEAAFKAALSRIDETFIVVDALDECSKVERKSLISLFTRLVSSKSKGVKILVTSRPENDLHQLLKNTTRFLIDANDTAKDIRPFVESVLTDHITSCAILDGAVTPDLKKRLIDTISLEADGMFLWAKLQLDHICGEPNEAGVIAQLSRLPSGLDNTYHRMWTNINNGSPSEKEWALKTLQWVLHAKRPLSQEEILEATALQIDSESSDVMQPASSADYLVRVCGNFIALDLQTNFIRFIHYSVQEFLKQKSALNTAEDLLAQSCFTVLGCRKGDEVRNMHLYKYATRYWERHSEAWNTIDDHRGTLIQNFLLNRERFADWQGHRGLYQGFRSAGYFRLTSFFNLPVILEHLCQLYQPDPVELSASLIIAADGGYITVLRHLLEAGADPNSQGGWCNSPLQIASHRGFDEIVAILLAAGADVNAGGGFYGSALNAAIARNSEALVKQLLNAGADANAEGEEDGPVLRAAVIKGSVKLVEILLAAKADIDAHSQSFTTALYTAARSGHTEIVSLLLKAGADPNLQSGKHSGTALYIASGMGNENVVRTLLAAGADANLKSGKSSFALCNAARNGHAKITKLLLDAGADVNASSAICVNAMEAVIMRPSTECVQLLLEAGADIQTRENRPLYLSVLYNRERMVELLLKFGADPNLCYPKNENALHTSTNYDSGRIVEVLLMASADTNFKSEGNTLLHVAAQSGSDRILQLILAAGLNPNPSPSNMLSPLHIAVGRQNGRSVGRLLAAGADPNAPGGRQGSPLQVAAGCPSLEILQLLLSFNSSVHAGEGDVGDPRSALYRASTEGFLGHVAVLLDAGADVSALGGEYGSALSGASYHAVPKVVQLLLKAGANVNALGGKFGSALQGAATCRGGDSREKENPVRVVELLLGAGADATAAGGKYHSALQAAAAKGSLPILMLLLKAGADVNAAGGKFGSPLQAAATRRNGEKFVEVLIDAGADVNALGGKFGSALQAAAAGGFSECVKLLLRAGSDPNARGGKFGAPLQAAAYAGSCKCLEHLLMAGANVNARSGLYGTARKASQQNRGTYDSLARSCVELLDSWGAIDGDTDSE